MRIGMVTACYKPVINGVTRMVSLYKRQLEAWGHTVFIFTLGMPDPIGDEVGIVRSPGLSLGKSGYFVSTRYTAKARSLLQSMDILHSHHLLMGLEFAHRYGRSPIVYTNHTRYDLYAATYLPIPQTVANHLMRYSWPRLTQLADVVIAPSQSIRQVMLNFGVPSPIEVIANGIDLSLFHTPTRPYDKSAISLPDTAIVLAYVGRLATEKNILTLLRQFAIAQAVVTQLHLLLIGTGPAQAKLQKEVAYLDIAAHVHFVGAVAYHEVGNYLAIADAFVTASLSEVHPLTVIEAMASGLPIVAVASPGITEMVTNGVTGLLATQPKALASSMIQIAQDQDSRRQMSIAAREVSTQFDIATTVQQTITIYERLLKCRDERRP